MRRVEKPSENEQNKAKTSLVDCFGAESLVKKHVSNSARTARLQHHAGSVQMNHLIVIERIYKTFCFVFLPSGCGSLLDVVMVNFKFLNGARRKGMVLRAQIQSYI